MINCKQNTTLLSQSQDRAATLRERMAMRLHLLLCKGCRNFKKQLAFLRKASRNFPYNG